MDKNTYAVNVYVNEILYNLRMLDDPNLNSTFGCLNLHSLPIDVLDHMATTLLSLRVSIDNIKNMTASSHTSSGRKRKYAEIDGANHDSHDSYDGSQINEERAKYVSMRDQFVHSIKRAKSGSE